MAVDPGQVEALVFDVFGTVVDWRSSIIREGRALGERLGIDADWEAFADAWRGMYQPAMERVRSGEREYIVFLQPFPSPRRTRRQGSRFAHRPPSRRAGRWSSARAGQADRGGSARPPPHRLSGSTP